MCIRIGRIECENLRDSKENLNKFSVSALNMQKWKYPHDSRTYRELGLYCDTFSLDSPEVSSVREFRALKENLNFDSGCFINCN